MDAMSYCPMKIDGVEVSLEHLAPILRKVNLDLRGGVKKVVSVEFRFSCHCFSRGLDAGEVPPDGHAVPDGSSHQPRPRVFDAERYELSKQLVRVIDELIRTNGRVSRTRHENFYRVELTPMASMPDLHLQYFVFFRARRLAPANRPRSLLVWVESAYPERAGVPPPRGIGARTFAAALGESW
jgi:hypothetical protein